MVPVVRHDTRTPPSWLLALVLPLVVAACTPDPEAPAAPDTHASPTEAAEPPPDPPANRCYRLSFDQALATKAPSAPDRPCRRPHSAETYLVGQLDVFVDGHQIAIDSARIRDQATRRCTKALPGFLGAEPDVVRRSMVRPIWFTPTLEQADAGAQWLRCDAVVVAGDRRLATASGGLRNALVQGLPDRYAMCGTTAPDADGFERVVCSVDHDWRAVSVVPFEAARYPGRDAAQDRGRATCEDVGAEYAQDPLDYRWSYEWPTKQQWRAGMTFGRCWVPD